MSTVESQMRELASRARAASRAMPGANPAAKVAALTTLATLLAEREPAILAANEKDLQAARERGMDDARLDRLRLTPAIMEEMRKACLHVANLPDPVGAMDSQWQRPNGLLVGRMRVPLGYLHDLRGPPQCDH